jgi:hypothetical protein
LKGTGKGRRQQNKEEQLAVLPILEFCTKEWNVIKIYKLVWNSHSNPAKYYCMLRIGHNKYKQIFLCYLPTLFQLHK